MSLVAGRTVTPSAEDVPDTDDGGEKVTAGSFWPEIALSDVRMEMRINGAVT
ncbi:MAG: capsid assembly protein, partial [Clostridia bacterium]|nr:capsid assembly protein [Clostridia bacterium]